MFRIQTDFYCKGNAVLINYVESMKDSVVVGLLLSFILQKISQEGKYCDRKPYKKPQYVLKKRISANLYMNFAILENFAINMILFKYK